MDTLFKCLVFFYLQSFLFIYRCVCVRVGGWVKLGSSLSFKHVWLNNKDTFCLYDFMKILSNFRISLLVSGWNLFNQTCLNERLLLNYTYLKIHDPILQLTKIVAPKSITVVLWKDKLSTIKKHKHRKYWRSGQFQLKTKTLLKKLKKII